MALALLIAATGLIEDRLRNDEVGSPESVERLTEIEKSARRCHLQNTDRAGDGQSAFDCGATRLAVVSEQKIGVEFEGETDRFTLTGIGEVDCRIDTNRGLDAQPCRFVLEPCAHLLWGGGMGEFRGNSRRNDDLAE